MTHPTRNYKIFGWKAVNNSPISLHYANLRVGDEDVQAIGEAKAIPKLVVTVNHPVICPGRHILRDLITDLARFHEIQNLLRRIRLEVHVQFVGLRPGVRLPGEGERAGAYRGAIRRAEGHHLATDGLAAHFEAPPAVVLGNDFFLGVEDLNIKGIIAGLQVAVQHETGFGHLLAVDQRAAPARMEGELVVGCLWVGRPAEGWPGDRQAFIFQRGEDVHIRAHGAVVAHVHHLVSRDLEVLGVQDARGDEVPAIRIQRLVGEPVSPGGHVDDGVGAVRRGGGGVFIALAAAEVLDFIAELHLQPGHRLAIPEHAPVNATRACRRLRALVDEGRGRGRRVLHNRDGHLLGGRAGLISGGLGRFRGDGGLALLSIFIFFLDADLEGQLVAGGQQQGYDADDDA